MCVRLVICGLSGVPYFSTLSHKQYDLKKKSLDMKRVFRFSLQLFSETFFILRRTERDMIKKSLLVFMEKYPLFLSDLSET